MFKKAKPTFLGQAGRNGAPSARKPMATPNNKKTAKRHASAMSKKNNAPSAKYVVKNGKPTKSVKTKSTMSGKKATSSISLAGKLSLDQRLSNYFSGKSPRKLTSATNSPQTAPQSFRPKG